MKDILILRHAKSARPAGVDDFNRPLNDRGYSDSPVVGKFIKAQDLVPDAVLCSAATRAKETAELVTEHAGFKKEIEFLESFYLCSPNVMMKALRELPKEVESAMIVAHNPTLEELTSILSGEGRLSVELPTAALVHMQFYSTAWNNLEESMAVLKSITLPRHLKAIGFA